METIDANSYRLRGAEIASLGRRIRTLRLRNKGLVERIVELNRTLVDCEQILQSNDRIIAGQQEQIRRLLNTVEQLEKGRRG